MTRPLTVLRCKPTLHLMLVNIYETRQRVITEMARCCI